MQKKVKGPEPWIMTLYYLCGGYWIFGGLMVLTLGIRSLAVVQGNPEVGGSPLGGFFMFVTLVVLAIGAFQALLGIGLLLKWEWTRAVVNIFCWIKIFFGVLGLFQALMAGMVFGSIWTVMTVFFNVLDIVIAGTQIWLISETDYSFMN